MTEWLIVFVAVLLAAMAPGPDFIVAIRNTLAGSRRAGLLTAFGFGAGVLVHAAYCQAGLAALIAQSVAVFTAFKILGAAYLFYLGVQALRSRGMTEASLPSTPGASSALSDGQAFRSGFLTNLLNPKATLFFLALFT